jgi:hypothetical protein
MRMPCPAGNRPSNQGGMLRIIRFDNGGINAAFS